MPTPVAYSGTLANGQVVTGACNLQGALDVSVNYTSAASFAGSNTNITLYPNEAAYNEGQTPLYWLSLFVQDTVVVYAIVGFSGGSIDGQPLSGSVTGSVSIVDGSHNPFSFDVNGNSLSGTSDFGGTATFYAIGTGASIQLDVSITQGASGTPAAPSGLDALAGIAAQVLLEWSAYSDTNATALLVYRAAGTGAAFSDASQIASVATTATSYTDTTTQYNMGYSYWIVAQGELGNSPPSNKASITTPTSVVFPAWNGTPR